MLGAFNARLVVVALLATGLPIPLPARAVPLANAQGYDQAQFVFAGTVLRAGSNVASLAADAPSSVVRVDKVYKGTPVFRDLAGRSVTVVVPAGTAPPKPGVKAVFLTASYLFGENAAVKLIGTEPLAAPDAMTRRVAALDAAAATTRLRASLAGGDVVVVGQVVGEPRPAPVQRSGGEHDPELRVAQLDVSSVERGKAAAKTLTVLFAASTDERWLRAPKLVKGERAVFTLQRDRELGAALGLPADLLARAYTAYQPDDVRPLSALHAVRTVLLQYKLR